MVFYTINQYLSLLLFVGCPCVFLKSITICSHLKSYSVVHIYYNMHVCKNQSKWRNVFFKQRDDMNLVFERSPYRRRIDFIAKKEQYTLPIHSIIL